MRLLLERNAEIVTLRDEVSELETQVEEKDGEIQAYDRVPGRGRRSGNCRRVRKQQPKQHPFQPKIA